MNASQLCTNAAWRPFIICRAGKSAIRSALSMCAEGRLAPSCRGCCSTHPVELRASFHGRHHHVQHLAGTSLPSTYKEVGSVSEVFQMESPGKFESLMKEFAGRAAIGHVHMPPWLTTIATPSRSSGSTCKTQAVQLTQRPIGQLPSVRRVTRPTTTIIWPATTTPELATVATVAMVDPSGQEAQGRKASAVRRRQRKRGLLNLPRRKHRRCFPVRRRSSPMGGRKCNIACPQPQGVHCSSSWIDANVASTRTT